MRHLKAAAALATLVSAVLAAVPAAALAGADLSVTLSDNPDPVVAGTNLTYTITVSNSGPDAASDVTLVDVVPTETTFVSLASPAGWSCTTPAVGAEGTVNCSAASVAAEATPTFTLVVHVPSTRLPNHSIINTAQSNTSSDDPLETNDSDAQQTTVTNASDLSATMSDSPDPVVAGSNLTYSITVVNAGPSDAASATFSDPLPTGTTFVSLTSPEGWFCTTPAVGEAGTVTCNKPSFAAGSAQFVLVVGVPAATVPGTVLENSLTASSFWSDPNQNNNEATGSTTTSVAANRSIAIAGPSGPVAAGADAAYDVTLTQAGPSVAHGVLVMIAFPPDARFKSFAAPAGFTCSAPAVGTAGGAVSCNAGSLAPGTSAFSLVLSVPGDTAVTSYAVTATVTATTPDPDPGAEPATHRTTVTPASAAPTPGPGSSAALAVGLSVPRQTLAAIRRARGIRARCTLDAAGTCRVRATISARVARRLKLRVPSGARQVSIGTARATLAQAGTAPLKIRLSAKVRRALGRATGTVKVAVRATGSAPGRTAASATKTLTAAL